ncbi:MAG: PDGLE domain-containing protein [Methanomicrobiales archaeon]|jgi:cobalt/nickel transport protein|nr:cobalt transport protein CbiN [Methanomicrobia archaeon]MDD1639816.1 PDGLE domain-containing protein [Methanomicrobiales archaeon]MDD1646080.1 PDGLE domain-containing protein [Methanomicrobiales archaeon]MDD1646307.1 PDGLE domain-containing protein [Methanomicrobiales archaeon]MDD1647865.1 PDGLE domain-containing protein [Methanomicrobiales archaeon]
MDSRRLVAAGIVLAILIAIGAVYLASPAPDGLESTALVVQGDKTLTGDTPPDAEVREDVAGRFTFESLLPDYSLGDAWGKPGEILALSGGILLMVLLIYGISRLMARPAK